MEKKEMLAAVAGCEFFKGLKAADLDRLIPLCHAKRYKSGEAVFTQGEVGEYLYVIVSGQVVLERAIDLGFRKGSVTIETLEKGRVLGCWATLLGEQHLLMSSAICQKPSRLLTLRGADLRYLMHSNKDLGFNVMEKFCFLLRDRVQAAYGALEKI
jgi:CRP-like cAMP-binding protein